MAIKCRRTIKESDGSSSIVYFGSHGIDNDYEEAHCELGDATYDLKKTVLKDGTIAFSTESKNDYLVNNDDMTEAVLHHIDDIGFSDTGKWYFDNDMLSYIIVHEDATFDLYVNGVQLPKDFKLYPTDSIASTVFMYGMRITGSIVTSVPVGMMFNNRTIQAMSTELYDRLGSPELTSGTQLSVANAEIKYDWRNDASITVDSTHNAVLGYTRVYTLAHDIGNWYNATCYSFPDDSGKIAFVGHAKFINEDEISVLESRVVKPVYAECADKSQYSAKYREYVKALADLNAAKHDNYAEDAEAVKEFLIQHLSLIKGELWYDMLNGLSLTNTKATKAMIDSDALDIISSCKYVRTITSFSSAVKNHTYGMSFKVQTYFGEIAINI